MGMPRVFVQLLRESRESRQVVLVLVGSAVTGMVLAVLVAVWLG